MTPHEVLSVPVGVTRLELRRAFRRASFRALRRGEHGADDYRLACWAYRVLLAKPDKRSVSADSSANTWAEEHVVGPLLDDLVGRMVAGESEDSAVIRLAAGGLPLDRCTHVVDQVYLKVAAQAREQGKVLTMRAAAVAAGYAVLWWLLSDVSSWVTWALALGWAGLVGPVAMGWGLRGARGLVGIHPKSDWRDGRFFSWATSFAVLVIATVVATVPHRHQAGRANSKTASHTGQAVPKDAARGSGEAQPTSSKSTTASGGAGGVVRYRGASARRAAARYTKAIEELKRTAIQLNTLNDELDTKIEAVKKSAKAAQEAKKVAHSLLDEEDRLFEVVKRRGRALDALDAEYPDGLPDPEYAKAQKLTARQKKEVARLKKLGKSREAGIKAANALVDQHNSALKTMRKFAARRNEVARRYNAQASKADDLWAELVRLGSYSGPKQPRKTPRAPIFPEAKSDQDDNHQDRGDR